MLWLSALMISSCTSIPRPRLSIPEPKGQLCTFDAQLRIAFCSQIGTGIKLSPLTVEDLDNWIMFDPESYKSIMDYISNLKESQ